MKPEATRIPGFGFRLSGVVSLLVVGALFVACPKPKPTPDPSEAGASTPSSATPVAHDAHAMGDAAHGKELVAKYECNRCHEGTGHPAATQNKHCVGCHKDIMEDRFQAPAASIARWKPRIKDLADAPSLEATGKRFTRAWLEAYMLQPSDLRPHLSQYMPRLALTPKDARDIAAYLAPEPEKAGAPDMAPIAGADLGKGRRLVDTKGCGTCHAFGGVAKLEASAPPAMDGKELERAHKLAPDLRVTRERMTPAKLVAWLRDPKAVKSDSAMPKIAMSDVEVKDLAGYLYTVELSAPVRKPKVTRLPVLTRKIAFKEVDEKVFHRTCWHCHSEPDYAIGDGGPGNSGGFGFKPRGLNLSDYNGIAAGFVDDKGERSSVFAKDGEGVPRMVRALLSRYEEESGAATSEVRGMPLGYEPLALEDIQLVESWIVQGRPR